MSGLEPREAGGRVYAGNNIQSASWPEMDGKPWIWALISKARIAYESTSSPSRVTSTILTVTATTTSSLMGEKREQDLELHNTGLDPSMTIY